MATISCLCGKELIGESLFEDDDDGNEKDCEQCGVKVSDLTDFLDRLRKYGKNNPWSAWEAQQLGVQAG
jgi:predicted methyltransferase